MLKCQSVIAGKIIIGGNSLSRFAKAEDFFVKYLKKSGDKYLDLESFGGEASISIAEIRRLKKWISLKPYLSPKKIAFIKEAQKLTPQAQNALLKTLEEPTSSTIIILETENLKLMLPTIISRLEIINIGRQKLSFSPQEMEKTAEILKTLTDKSPGERLKIAQELAKGKKPTIGFVTLQLLIFEEELKKNPSLVSVHNIKSAQFAYRALQANCQPFLALGNLFLTLS